MALINLLVGLLTGVLSGFGIGGGTLLILWLTLFCGMDQLQAGGINLVYFSCAAIPALCGHGKNKLIEARAAIPCIAAGVPACIAAALFAAETDVSLLRRGFGVLLLVIGMREVFGRNRGDGKAGGAQNCTDP